MIKILSLIFISIIIFRFIRFITTPLLKKIGVYKYYSPMLMIMPWFFNTYDIHLGTSWDLLKMKKLSSRKILEFIAVGFIQIASLIEKEKININSNFRGNTFYLNKDTITRFGFKTRRMNSFETILFMFNYAELCVLSTIVRKKIIFIPLKNLMIVEMNAAEILSNKEKFENLYNLLKSNTINKRVFRDITKYSQFTTANPHQPNLQHAK